MKPYVKSVLGPCTEIGILDISKNYIAEDYNIVCKIVGRQLLRLTGFYIFTIKYLVKQYNCILQTERNCNGSRIQKVFI